MLSDGKRKDLQERLGRNIQKIRKAKGYSQEKLAEKADLALTSIAYIEAGYNFPAFPTLYKISQVLGVEVKDLIPF